MQYLLAAFFYPPGCKGYKMEDEVFELHLWTDEGKFSAILIFKRIEQQIANNSSIHVNGIHFYTYQKEALSSQNHNLIL